MSELMTIDKSQLRFAENYSGMVRSSISIIAWKVSMTSQADYGGSFRKLE
jgi:hypothetical protein